MAFLKILADDNYRGHMSCPCGSNIKLRNCHGNIVRELQNFQSPGEYLNESVSILCFMKDKGQDISFALFPRAMVDKIKKYAKSIK
jgi:hypothetical protein